MNVVGSANQTNWTHIYRADATMTGSAQLVLARSTSRSCLVLQNLGANSMFVEFGGARAHATLTNGVVSSVTVDNGGFGFTLPPTVIFLGGGGDVAYAGLAQPGAQAPQHVAQAHCVLSGNAVNSVTIDDGGALYRVAPYVLLINSVNDPNGAATPSSTSGFTLPANMTAPISFNGTMCPTDQIAVIGTASQVLFCGYTP